MAAPARLVPDRRQPHAEAVHPPEAQALGSRPQDNPTDDNVFDRKEFVYGTDARHNVGFGFWQFAWGSKQTLDADHYATARSALMSMKGDHGRPLGIKPRLLVVPPALEGAANRLMTNDNLANGASNEWKGTAEVMVCPGSPDRDVISRAAGDPGGSRENAPTGDQHDHHQVPTSPHGRGGALRRRHGQRRGRRRRRRHHPHHQPGHEGFRRGGIAHPADETYPLSRFTEGQLKLIQDEPMLTTIITHPLPTGDGVAEIHTPTPNPPAVPTACWIRRCRTASPLRPRRRSRCRRLRPAWRRCWASCPASRSATSPSRPAAGRGAPRIASQIGFEPTDDEIREVGEAYVKQRRD